MSAAPETGTLRRDAWPTRRRGSWPAILFIFLYAELIAACHGKSLILVGDVARSFAVSPARASWVIGAVALVAALFAPLGGWLIDRTGEKRAITGGLTIAASTSLACTFVPKFEELIVLRVIEGGGYIAVVLGCLSLLIRTTHGPRQTTALAFWSVASPMGGALAIACASLLAGTPYWRLVFAGHSALLVLAVLASPLLPDAPPREHHGSTTKPALLAIYREPAVVRFLGAILLLQIVALGEGSLVPTYLIAQHHIAPTLVGILSALGIGLSVLGGVVAGYLFNRGTNVGSVTGSALVIGTASAILSFLPFASTPLVLAARLVSSISGGFIFAWISTSIPRVTPHASQIGATSGAVSQLLYIGMTLGPATMFALYSLPTRAAFYGVIILAHALPLVLLAARTFRQLPTHQTVVVEN